MPGAGAGTIWGPSGLTPGANPHIDRPTGRQRYDVLADAVAYDPSRPVTNIATWTPTLPASGQYRVYARWPADTSWATNATPSPRGRRQHGDGEPIPYAAGSGCSKRGGCNVKLNDQADEASSREADAMAFRRWPRRRPQSGAVWTPATLQLGLPTWSFRRWCCAFSGSASGNHTIYRRLDRGAGTRRQITAAGCREHLRHGARAELFG